MHFAIHIETSRFDLLSEEKNPINPIYGQSLLLWLQKELGANYEFSEVDAEDWGWYCFIEFKGRSYMLGSSAFFEEGDDPAAEIEWVFQIDKHRSFKETLLFKEKMNENDECLNFFKSYFESQNDIKVLSVE